MKTWLIMKIYSLITNKIINCAKQPVPRNKGTFMDLFIYLFIIMECIYEKYKYGN